MKAFNRDEAVGAITAGRCRCDRCVGHLCDQVAARATGACPVCGRAWQATLVNATAYASTIPSALHGPVTPAKSQGK